MHHEVPSPLSTEDQKKLADSFASVELKDCYVYHWFDLPDGRTITGSWDLRENWRAYLGHIDFRGLRVIEVGPASGFLSLKMEEMGAEVVAFDLPPGIPPDTLPLPGCDMDEIRAAQARAIDRVRNSWWYFRKQFNSRNKALYGDIYRLPPGIGRFDVSVLGAVLLHLENPFEAIRQVAAVTERAIVVTDLFHEQIGDRPYIEFSPAQRVVARWMCWWLLSPAAVSRMLTAVGFPVSRVFFHNHRHHPEIDAEKFATAKFFSVVAMREEAIVNFCD